VRGILSRVARRVATRWLRPKFHTRLYPRRNETSERCNGRAGESSRFSTSRISRDRGNYIYICDIIYLHDERSLARVQDDAVFQKPSNWPDAPTLAREDAGQRARSFASRLRKEDIALAYRLAVTVNPNADGVPRRVNVINRGTNRRALETARPVRSGRIFYDLHVSSS